MSWQLKIQKYNGVDARISRTEHLNAGDFNDARKQAEQIVRGMRFADPASKYEIVQLLTHDYRGIDCENGGHMFETGEEFSKRVASVQ